MERPIIWQGLMTYFFFILLNGVLLVRPEEIYPDIAGLRLYLILIAICTLGCFKNIVTQLRTANLSRRPISVLVVGLLFSVVLSQLIQGHNYVLDDFAPEFLKVVLYYFVLVSVIDSPRRLVQFFGWIVVIVVILATIALLNFHGEIDIESIDIVTRTEVNSQTGEVYQVRQLQATGIYADPNDFCLILTTGVVFALCRSYLSRSLPMKLCWFAPIFLFGYAIFQTQSRGGLLGLMFGIFAFVYVRYGVRRSMLLVPVLFGAIMFASGGRQGDMDTSGGTAQHRYRLWSDGFAMMMSKPLYFVTGIGAGEHAAALDLVAHNSFVHAYVELGMLGGSIFLGAFYLAVMGLWRVRTEKTATKTVKIRGLYPFIFAAVLGYAGGSYSVSRNYVIPTYMILGISTVYLRLAYPTIPHWLRFDRRMVRRLSFVGVAGFIFLKLFTQIMVKY